MRRGIITPRALPGARPRTARQRRLACLVVSARLLGAVAPALADERPRPATVSTAPAPPGASESATAGWALVVLSLAAGTAVTLTGLAIDCAEADRGCRRRSSLAIAGGVGVASLGSAIGLSLVQASELRSTTPSGARWQLAPQGERATMQRSAGAMLVLSAELE